jgi:hypothetical protein
MTRNRRAPQGGWNADPEFVRLRGRYAGADAPEKKAHAEAAFEAYRRKRYIELLREELAELTAAGEGVAS